MRIAEVAEFYSPTGGGVRSYIDRKFDAAAALGHELFVIAPGPEDRFEPRPAGGLVVVKSPRLPMDANYHVFWNAAAVHARLDQLKPDLAEASSPWRGAQIVANWRSATPRAMFVHADPVASYPHRWLGGLASPESIDRMFGWFWAYLRRLSGRFSGVVVGGAWLEPRLRSQGVDRVTSIPLGVDRSVFSPALRNAGLRAELLAACGLPPSARLLLGVGRFHPEKRWPMIIEAVRRAGDSAPLGLALVGDGLDRRRVAAAAGTMPNMVLRPPIRDRREMGTLLASGDMLVHGCESETFGLVAAEAMASGLPLVVPDRGGCAHLADPATSELYRAADVDAAAEAIRRLVARDGPALREAAVRVAADVRSDLQHYAGLFDYYSRVTRDADDAAA